MLLRVQILFPILLGTTLANLLGAIPSNATPGALKWQPVLDFDTDTCLHTAAIDEWGNLNSGLATNQFVQCSDGDRLWHANTYARQRCNHGWCAYMYAYYAEMDGTGAGGHRHDWEHVIVWTLNDEVFFVSWSAHGDYTTEYHTSVRFDGTHPKIVAHHGWGSLASGSLRKATADDDKIESPWGQWFRSWLLSRETMNDAIGHKLTTADWGSGHLDLKDERFGDALDRAMPWDARNNEHFDPWN